MRAPEEIKYALHWCRNSDANNQCLGCPYKKIEDCEHALEADALAYIQQLEAQMVRDLDAAQGAHWIPCAGKSHIWYCSRCGERINYNQARRTYKPEGKPVHEVNRWCRGCGAKIMEG
jgi:hypothetical protein